MDKGKKPTLSSLFLFFFQIRVEGFQCLTGTINFFLTIYVLTSFPYLLKYKKYSILFLADERLVSISVSMFVCNKHMYINILTWWYKRAGRERISSIARQARARWQMVNNLTLGINATHSRTRVYTVKVLAGARAWTISIDGTFRPAGNVWIAKVFWDALAGGGSGTVAANGVVSAGGWVARVYYFCRGRCYNKKD